MIRTLFRYGDRMTEWRRSPVVAVVAITLFLTVQIAIPVGRLASEEPAAPRFGWQMFSTYQPEANYVVVTESETIDVDLEEVTARLRADLDLPAWLPPHLCSTIPGALSVGWGEENYRC